nr:hypothetical protein [Sphingomonas formosensis]
MQCHRSEAPRLILGTLDLARGESREAIDLAESADQLGRPGDGGMGRRMIPAPAPAGFRRIIAADQLHRRHQQFAARPAEQDMAQPQIGMPMLMIAQAPARGVALLLQFHFACCPPEGSLRLLAMLFADHASLPQVKKCHRCPRAAMRVLAGGDGKLDMLLS